MGLLNLSIARLIAYDAFIAVMGESKSKPEEVLEELYGKHQNKLKRLDRNFIKELLYGSLRWYSKIFWILQNTSKRDLEKVTQEIRASLIAGTYQIYYMDKVPDRAAVNESVEYVRKKGQANACSFVNGILRQIARKSKYFQKPDKRDKPVEYLSLQYAHPPWIVERWSKRFKYEKLESLLSANNRPPPYSVRINLKKVSINEVNQLQQRLLKEESCHSERCHLRTALRLKNSPLLAPESLFAQGYYTIQGEASQLIGLLVEPQPKETVVEACVGPGGKLSHICELSKDADINIIGIDSSKRQLERARETLTRLGHGEGELIEGDFLKWSPKKKVDRILLDAPCSGLGVLRRHPEGKWHKDPACIPGLARNQMAMITHALKQLKVGGELIYSVCSFEPEETEHHLRQLNKEFAEKVQIVSPLDRLPDYYKRYVTRKHLLLIYPGNQDSMDGFGAFILKVLKRI